MSALTIHRPPHGAAIHAAPAKRWRRRFAVSTLSVSSLLVALSTLAYRSFVHLPM